ncbi:hypothetical protein [Pseudorhodoplanes sp.]|uniref:hypothetical protein n=1 Tax=Pseudorhodoplanes sp. TaxID=1934341 RepID=UPI003D0BEA7F
MNTEDDDKILKDGAVLKVPQMMMDAAALAPITDKAFVSDHHKPHHVAMSNDQRNAAADRQALADKRLSDAWRDPPPMFVGATPEPVMGVHADKVGTNGHDHNRPVTDTTGLDALQAANERRYAAKISEMWKNPGAR